MGKPICLHDYRVHKMFMDAHPEKKNMIYVKEIQLCSKCFDKRAFTYSQEIQDYVNDKTNSDESI